MDRHLNPEQRLAVETVQGRVLILAGAGSGKTLVLTLRMAHLIKNLNVSPKAILGLTFTNKAAAEMRHRIGSFVDSQSAKQVTLCTFHSFCMQILRQEIHRLGYTNHFTLYDEQDVQRVVNMIARDLLQHEGELPSMASTMAIIHQAKNKGVKPDEMDQSGFEWHDSFTKDLYTRLLTSMRAYNAVDFDSLLSLTVELFERFPEVLDHYQERFRYVMIDEYQDTNPIQYRLAALLSAKYQNLCVVGDDDQSIYGWRGADVRNILDFANATVIKLQQNYRSTNTILSAANAVISRNQARHAKALWSERGSGNCIEIFHAPNEIDEAQAVAKRLVKLHETHGIKWGEMAILYRSNALSRQFEMALMHQTWKKGDKWIQGIPYEIVGGTEFYQRREVKDLCAYLRVITNPSDQEALLRIINQPRRGIGDDSLEVITAYNRAHARPLWDVLKGLEDADLAISASARRGVTEFVRLIEEAKEQFAQGNLSEAMQWMVDKIDYQKAVREEVKSQQMRDFKWENVQEFISALAEFEQQTQQNHPMPPDQLLDAFISNSALDNQAAHFMKGKQGSEDCVHLMTFHSAKGLEFPACFLIGMEDHIIPHEKSVLETGVEEERRLMYVAITRAKEHLTISMAKQRKRMGKESLSRPSRFLFEIPKELLKMTDWR